MLKRPKAPKTLREVQAFLRRGANVVPLVREIPADTLLREIRAGEALEAVTVTYGVANWHAYNGRHELAQRLLHEIAQGSQWAAFGFIGAEADLIIAGLRQ